MQGDSHVTDVTWLQPSVLYLMAILLKLSRTQHMTAVLGLTSDLGDPGSPAVLVDRQPLLHQGDLQYLGAHWDLRDQPHLK